VAYDPASDAVTNGKHPFQDKQTLRPEVTKATVYVSGDYELGDSTTAYAEVLLNRRETIINGYRQYYTFGTFGNSWDFDDVSAGGNALDYGWGGDVFFSPTPVTDIDDSKITVDYTRFVFGVTGDIGDTGWYYDVSVQSSRSDGEYGSDIIYGDVIYDQEFITGSCVRSPMNLLTSLAKTLTGSMKD
jgi:iron complex outermembrane receptor protein